MTEIRAATTPDALAYELRIEAPPRDVFAYWVDPQRMTRWMGKVATLDARPGGTFRLDYGNGDVAAGTYLEVDEPRRVVLTWGWEAPGDPVPPGASRIEVDLEGVEEGSATILRLRHTGLPGDSRSSHDEGWNHFLASLAAAIVA